MLQVTRDIRRSVDRGSANANPGRLALPKRPRMLAGLPQTVRMLYMTQRRGNLPLQTLVSFFDPSHVGRLAAPFRLKATFARQNAEVFTPPLGRPVAKP